jgi:hypothetical protein
MRTGTWPLGRSRGSSFNVTRLVSRCQTRRLGPAPPAQPPDRGETAGPEGWSPSRPVDLASGVRGENYVRRAVGAESNPLPSLSRTAVRWHSRLASVAPVEPAGAPAVEHEPGRATRPRRSLRPHSCGTNPRRPEVVRASERAVDGVVAPVDASGGLMLVTAAGCPLRRPTSDPWPFLELRRPDVPYVGLRTADPSDRGAVHFLRYTLLWPSRSGVLCVEPRPRWAGRVAPTGTNITSRCHRPVFRPARRPNG